MSVHEIEAALAGLSAQELAHVEATLRGRAFVADANGQVANSPLKNGFDVFPKRNGERITIAMVRQLCAEEGI